MANRVTFIIGNGLDLSLGLETKYQHFYEYVKNSQLGKGNRIYEEIARDHKTWADFEASLGQYTAYIKTFPEAHRRAESIAFHRELEGVRNDLAEYLKSQEAQAKNLPDSFLFSATESGFFEDLNLGQRTKIQNLMQRVPNYFNFITLNYTYTLEKILSGELLLKSRGYHLKTPLHIHGDADTYMTLGVSDESQLYTGMSEREKRYLIKSHLIAAANDGRMDSFRGMLHGSTLVVLFGTSLGETDAYIWEELINWLSAHPERHVLIHKHDETYTPVTRRSIWVENEFIEKTQEQLLNHSPLSENEKEELKRRIFVIHNTKKLFVTAN